jgi:curved DNA-binding protein CbpA
MRKNEALDILGLEESSTEEERNKAYRRLALLHHPDRHSREAESIREEHAELFKKVGEAYEVLTKESNDNPLDDSLNDWYSGFYKSPTRAEYLERFTELFQEAGLALNNLQVFNSEIPSNLAVKKTT